MTSQEWMAEVLKRVEQNEGRRAAMYHDTLGVPTIGIGFNLQRSDAASAMALIGVGYNGVMAGSVSLTNEQIDKLFTYSFLPIISEARGSLLNGVFDKLSDARRFVICDLVYNEGLGSWMDFVATRALIAQAQNAKDLGHIEQAGMLFGMAADHLAGSEWYTEVGDRAVRNVAMMRTSLWVPDLTG